MYYETERRIANANELKAKAFDITVTYLNNALCYLYENGMSKEEVADYIGSDVETLDDIYNEDYEELSKIADW